MTNEIDLDEVDDLYKRRKRINDIKIADAVFVRSGKVVEVSQQARDDFEFTGLSTIDFVLSDFQKNYER